MNSSIEKDKKNLEVRLVPNAYFPFKRLVEVQELELGCLHHLLRCDSEKLEEVFAAHRSTEISFQKIGRRNIYRYFLRSPICFRGDTGCYMHDISRIIDKVMDYAMFSFPVKDKAYLPLLSIYFNYQEYNPVKKEVVNKCVNEFILNRAFLHENSFRVNTAPFTLARLNAINQSACLYHIHAVHFCVEYKKSWVD